RIIQNTPSAANSIYHSREIRRLSLLRQIEALGAEMQTAAKDVTADPSEIVRRIDVMASQLGDVGEGSKLVTYEEAARKAVARMKAAATGSGPAVPSGFFSLDARMSGFFPSELVILAARPGVGKSAFAVQVCAHNALKGRSVLLVSLEMDSESILAREIAADLKTEVRRIRSGKVTPEQMAAAERFCDSASGVPL